MSQGNVIKLTLTPEQVYDSLPVDFLTEGTNTGQGFSDKDFDVTVSEDGALDDTVKYSISYDGESELLATVIVKPDTVSDDEAENLLRNFFENAEADEDEDEEEKEPVSA